MSTHFLRLSPWRVGIGFGFIWALGLFILALISHNTIYYGHPFIQSLDSVYIGYSPTVEGAFVGLCWGFINFFIFGWLVAWLYNILLPRQKD
jgi:hypothetical protein